MSKIIILFPALLLASCGSIRDALPSYQISVGVEKEFQPHNITDPNQFLGSEIAKAYSRILDSLSTVYGYKYFPNYPPPEKHQPTFILKGIFGIQDWNVHLKKYFVKGAFLAPFDSLTYPAIEVYYDDSSDLFNNIVEYAMKGKPEKDSVVPVIPTTLRMSGTLVSLVPYANILAPKNGTGDLDSFSINDYIYTREKKDRKKAAILTNLMNNILVFKQHSYGLYLRPEKNIRYNYYPNYRLKKSSKKVAKYNIGGKLIEQGDKYKLTLSFSGPDINLIAPSKIDTVVFLRKATISRGDYSDIIIKLSQRLNAFTWQQGNFFN